MKRRSKFRICLITLITTVLLGSTAFAASGSYNFTFTANSSTLYSGYVSKGNTTDHAILSPTSGNLTTSRYITMFVQKGGSDVSQGYKLSSNSGSKEISYNTTSTGDFRLKAVPSAVGPTSTGSWTP